MAEGGERPPKRSSSLKVTNYKMFGEEGAGSDSDTVRYGMVCEKDTGGKLSTVGDELDEERSRSRSETQPGKRIAWCQSAQMSGCSGSDSEESGEDEEFQQLKLKIAAIAEEKRKLKRRQVKDRLKAELAQSTKELEFLKKEDEQLQKLKKDLHTSKKSAFADGQKGLRVLNNHDSAPCPTLPLWVCVHTVEKGKRRWGIEHSLLSASSSAVAMYSYNDNDAALTKRLSPIYEEDKEDEETIQSVVDDNMTIQSVVDDNTTIQSVVDDNTDVTLSEVNHSSNVLTPEKPSRRSMETGNEPTPGQPPYYYQDKKTAFIESHSGRRHDITEVLKQKYINNDIQDLPRFVPGPIRYGRLHRSRASRVNLASLDIRAQMNTLRLHNMEAVMKEGSQKYRCGKLDSSVDVDKLKSLRQLLQDEFSALDDEYDHEVAAICESYSGELQEGCCRMSSDRASVVSRDASCELDCTDVLPVAMVDRRFHDYAVCKDTKIDFWKGFAKGMRLLNSRQSNNTEMQNETIESKELIKEVTKDPCLETVSHKMIIDNIQDVTHKSLRDWEQRLRDESHTPLPPSNKCDTPHSEEFQMCKTTEVEIVIPSKDSDELMQPKCTPLKVRPRRTITLAKTDIDLPVTANHRLRNCKDTVSSDDNTIVVATAIDERNTHLNLRWDRKITNDINGEETKRRRKKLQKGSPREIALHDREEHTQIKQQSLTTEVDGEMNIVKIAKKRLENITFSSPNFEPNHSPTFETKKSETNIERHDSQRLLLEDLNGWTTHLKTYSDILDNIRLSSSELLHPVDSMETVGGARNTPQSPWQNVDPTAVKSIQSNVSPIESPISFAMRKRAGTVSKLAMSPDLRIKTPARCASKSARATPTNTSIYDLSDKSVGKSVYETNAFKHKRGNIAPFTEIGRSFSECTPKRRVIPMRLTKSMNEFTSKSGIDKKANYRNTPTLRCQNYNTEKQLMSKITANINLSETLAKQLKTIGKDRANTWQNTADHENQLCRPLTLLSEKETSPTQHNVSELPAIGGRGLLVSGVQNNDRSLDNSTGFTLPNIHQQKAKPVPTNHYQLTTTKEHDTTSVELPPIGVRSLLNASSPSTPTNREMDIDAWPKSLPVRKEVCTSPYTFDKSNPKKLQIAARPLTNIHSVCTSCGSISQKSDNTSGHERILKSKTSSQSTKNAMHQCTDQAGNDGKWHLEGDSKFFDRKLPEIRAKLTRHIQKQTSRNQEIKSNNNKSQRKSRHHEEMSFKFMDQNIKVRFECEISLKNGLNGCDKKFDTHPRRIDSLAAPATRDKMKCTMAKETRIYKECRKGKKPRKSKTEEMQSESNSPSSYVEYCKLKTKLWSIKSEQYKDEYLSMLSDTCTPSEKKTTATVKHKMPIIPQKSEEKARKSKEKNRGINKLETCDSPRHEELNSLCITSEHLPLMKARVSSRSITNKLGETLIREFEEGPDEPIAVQNGDFKLSADTAVKMNVEITN